MSGPLLLAVAAQDFPVHIGAQLLAQNGVAVLACCSFNRGAMLGWNLPRRVEPWPDVSAIRESQQLRQSGLATNDRSRLAQCSLLGGVDVAHAAESIRNRRHRQYGVDDPRNVLFTLGG